jgi:SAM-dependent methyltransferase
LPDTPSGHSTYRGLHAARYDLIYGAKPYSEEAAFVARLLEEHGSGSGRLLDLACGTGRHAREFAALGYEVTGIDYSSDQVEAARRNAPGVSFHRQDMRELDLGSERFDAITCLFDSIGYPQTNEGVLAALERARVHLAPGGTLVVEFLHAAALLRHGSPVRVARWSTPSGGELVRISEVELDLRHDVMRVSYELFELAAEGDLLDHSTEEHANRYFTSEGMRALMSSAGLRAVAFVPAYVDSADIDDSVWHVLAVAKAEDRG